MALSLPRAPKVLFFFGLAGAGKSFVSDVVSRATGWHVYQADGDLPERALRAIERGEILSEDMRDEIFRIVADRLLELTDLHGRVVASQAAYKERHREYLHSRVPSIETIWVTAPEATLRERLASRTGPVGIPYAERMRAGFEEPNATTPRIENDGGPERIIEQITRLYG